MAEELWEGRRTQPRTSMRLVAMVMYLLIPGLVIAQSIPDSSFGDNGFALIKMQPLAFAPGIAFTSDGGTVHVGSTINPGFATHYSGSFLSRLDASGRPLLSFGDRGTVMLTDTSQQFILRFTAVTELRDGRLLASGFSHDLDRPEYLSSAVVMAFLPNGERDHSFGDNGILDLHPRLQTVWEYVIYSRTIGLVESSTGITIYGTHNGGHFIARVDQNGVADSAFGQLGVVLSRDSTPIEHLAIQADGKSIVTGYGPGLGRSVDWVAVGYQNTGLVDSAFGLNGRVSRDMFGSSSDFAQRVSVLSNGRILVSGVTTVHDPAPAIPGTTLMLLTPDGQFDHGFGFEGLTWTDVFEYHPGEPLWTGDERAGHPFETPTGFGVVVGSPFFGAAGQSETSTGLAVLRVFSTGDPDRIEYWFTDKPNLTFSDAIERDGHIVATGVQRIDSRFEPFVAKILLRDVVPTTAEDAPSLRAALSVSPNPGSGTSFITLTLPSPTRAAVTIVDALGRTVATPADGYFLAGPNTVSWDASRLAQGTYAVVANAGAERTVTRITVVH